MTTRWIAGIIAGLFVWLVVFMVLAFFLGRMVENIEPLDTLVGFVVPALLGLFAGIQSFRRSVSPKQPK